MTAPRPCPWCETLWLDVHKAPSGSYYVNCHSCGATGPDADTNELAISYWNTRPAPAGRLAWRVGQRAGGDRLMSAKERTDWYWKPEDIETITVLKSTIPQGAKLIEAYETETRFVIMGQPPDADNFPEEHNCDEMGCGSLAHVMYVFLKQDAWLPTRAATTPAADAPGEASQPGIGLPAAGGLRARGQSSDGMRPS